ncbi:MAG: alginate lyase family protein [Solirubrobacteraceae bacterium]
MLLTAAAFAIAAQAPPAAARMQPGIWLTRAEISRLPVRGPAWGHLKDAADAPAGRAHLADQNADNDVHVLAAALVYARTGEQRYRREVATGVLDAIGTERGGRTLALARGLVAYVVAADLIDLRHYDPGKDARFRTWLAAVRTERLTPSDNPTLVATHELRPNNWGTHAGASRIAADVYLGDTRDLARAAAVFKGWLGDRRAYHGFRFGARSWQANPSAPVGVDPPGAMRDGLSIDGALPDDMRRGCGLRFPPCPTLYAWEAMQGAVVQAELLSRQGYDAWEWGHQALRRGGVFLFDLYRRYGAREWGAPEGHGWIPWLLNARYGTQLPTSESAQPGKGMGFTDWTAAAGCGTPPCDGPRGPRRAVHPVAAAAHGPPGGGAAGADWPVWAALGAGALVVAAMLRRAQRGRQRAVGR